MLSDEVQRDAIAIAKRGSVKARQGYSGTGYRVTYMPTVSPEKVNKTRISDDDFRFWIMMLDFR